MTDLKTGILLWSQATPGPSMLDAAERVDQLGYDHLWTWDHLYAIFGDPYQPIFEGWTLARRLGDGDRADAARPAGRRQHVPQPGLVAKTRGDPRSHQRRPRDPRHRRGVDRARAQAHGIEFGPASASASIGWTRSVGAMRGVLDGESVTSSRAAGTPSTICAIRRCPSRSGCRS